MRNVTYITLILASLWLPGCAAMTAVSVVQGTLIDAASSQFQGEEKCMPNNLDKTLAAVQSSLRNMHLDVDVLEIQERGYGITFGNGQLDGEITLTKVTGKLTTVYVQVRKTMREESVEQAIIESVQANLEMKNPRKRFRFNGYHNLRTKPDIKTARLGWYRHNAKLDTHRNGKSDWFTITLPSGKLAYLKGNVLEAKKRNKYVKREVKKS